MTMRKVFDWCLAHWSFVAFVIAIFVQFTPAIKFNPFTVLFKWIGNLITADVRKDAEAQRKEIAEIKTMIEAMDRTRMEDKKDTIRWEILNFATSCRNGIKHTQDDFEHVIAQHDKYVKLLEATHDTNGVFAEEYAYILRIYHNRQDKNDFL